MLMTTVVLVCILYFKYKSIFVHSRRSRGCPLYLINSTLMVVGVSGGPFPHAGIKQKLTYFLDEKRT